MQILELLKVSNGLTEINFLESLFQFTRPSNLEMGRSSSPVGIQSHLKSKKLSKIGKDYLLTTNIREGLNA